MPSTSDFSERTKPTHAGADGGDAARVAEIIRRRAVTPVFQPIVDLSAGAITGFEALTRPSPDSGVAHVGELFDLAARSGQLWSLEEVTRSACVHGAEGWPDSLLLFFNSSPQVFGDHRYARSVRDLVAAAPGLSPGRIVLEITERAEDPESDALAEQVRHLKAAGFQIAIDDVGAGTSGVRRIMALRPQWLKLDRDLVDHIDTDPYKQNFIDFFVHFAKLSGVNIVAEGIERIEELGTLIELGVGFGQGYLLGHPGARGQGLDPELSEWIVERAASVERGRVRGPRGATVGELMRPVLVCDASTAIGDANATLMVDDSAPGLAMLDGRRYAGWLSRAVAMRAATASPLAEAGDFVRSGAIAVDPGTPLVEAIRSVASRIGDELHEPLIVASPGKVLGMLTITDLLKASARLAGGMAQQNGAITGLPGRAQCDRRLTTLLRRRVHAEAAFIDILGFTAFNEQFGYEIGDLLLRILAGLVTSAASGAGESEDAIAGHLGDDRFLLVKTDGPIEPVVRRLAAEFEQAAQRFLGAGSARRAGRGGWGLRVAVLTVGESAEPRDLHTLAEQLRRVPKRTGPGPEGGASQFLHDRRSRAAFMRRSA